MKEKKNTRNKGNTILLFLLAMFFCGCDSYLDTTDPNNLSKDALGQSEADLTLLLMGCYDGAQRNYQDAYRYLECLSDVGYGMPQINEGGGTPQNGQYQTYWTRSYRLIGRCNELISTIEGIDSPNEKIFIINSEAKFLRALGYYYLMVLYKDVPLITSRQSFDDRYVTKNTQEEIKAQIIKDLDDATLYLPIDPVYPKVSKGAALTLKAKVHLFFNEWQNVADVTNEIINLNHYALYENYATLFSEEAEGNKEGIFSIAFESGMGEGEAFSGCWPLQPNQMDLRPLRNFVDAFYCTDGLPITTSPLYDEELFYENRDPRLDVNIVHKGQIWINGLPYNSGTSVTGFSLRKYIRNTTLFRGDGPVDFMVMRYADVLLMRAEALVELNKIDDEVYRLVDMIRQRVQMPRISEVEGNNLSQNELREIVRHERFVELSLEGSLRWIDIKRWGIVEEVYKTITFHKRVFQGEKTYYWPIPQVEIDNNPNLTQHDFWD